MKFSTWKRWFWSCLDSIMYIFTDYEPIDRRFSHTANVPLCFYVKMFEPVKDVESWRSWLIAHFKRELKNYKTLNVTVPITPCRRISYKAPSDGRVRNTFSVIIRSRGSFQYSRWRHRTTICATLLNNLISRSSSWHHRLPAQFLSDWVLFRIILIKIQ